MAKIQEMYKFIKNLTIFDKLYINPPADVRPNYAIIKLDTIDEDRADNRNYRLRDRYVLTYVSTSDTDETARKLLELPNVRFDRAYKSPDNTYNEVYIIF